MRLFAFGVLAIGVAASPVPPFAHAAGAQRHSCDEGTTYEIRTCWDRQDVAARAELASAYGKTSAALRQSRLGTARLVSAQGAWDDARDRTCAFEYQLYLPGTIAPQLGVECAVRMTRARTQRLSALLIRLRGSAATPAERALSPAADSALSHLYRLYSARLTKDQRSALVAAQAAWSAYRGEACALEGGSCLTELTKERIAELEASWVGEAFW